MFFHCEIALFFLRKNCFDCYPSGYQCLAFLLINAVYECVVALAAGFSILARLVNVKKIHSCPFCFHFASRPCPVTEVSQVANILLISNKISINKNKQIYFFGAV